MDFELFEIACWDNEGEGEGEGQGQGQGTGEGEGTGEGSKKIFTREDVNKIVINRQKALKTQYQQLEQNYEGLLQQQNLSNEQREKLEQDLENVRSLIRTKDQNIAAEKKKHEEKYAKDIKAATDQATFYKSLYENSTIERAIIDAASGKDAYDPSQFVSFLKDKTKVIEELDSSGQKTGRLVPRVEWEVLNPETKQREKVLKAPEEVIDSMKEDTQKYGNLFKSNFARGLNSSNSFDGPRGKVDVSKMSAAEYMSYRNTPEGKAALGLRN